MWLCWLSGWSWSSVSLSLLLFPPQIQQSQKNGDLSFLTEVEEGKSSVQELQAAHAETILELQKTRTLLSIESKISKDYKVEGLPADQHTSLLSTCLSFLPFICFFPFLYADFCLFQTQVCRLFASSALENLFVAALFCNMWNRATGPAGISWCRSQNPPTVSKLINSTLKSWPLFCWWGSL